jgi:hypothetical protein
MFGQLKIWLRMRLKRDARLECFIYFLRKSQLCTEQQIVQVVSSFEMERGDIASGDAVTQFCDFIVSKNIVTAWQCDKLKAGRCRGFYLDDYLLLEVVDQDNTSRSYRARDLRDGTTVRLVVFTKERQSPHSEYRVERSIEK